MSNLFRIVLLIALAGQIFSQAEAEGEEQQSTGANELLEAMRSNVGIVVERELKSIEHIWERDKSLTRSLQDELEKAKNQLANLYKNYQDTEAELKKRLGTKEAEAEDLEKYYKTNQQKMEGIINDLRVSIRDHLNEMQGKQGEQKLRNQRHEARVLHESMLDKDKSRRCLRYFILFNQGGNLTPSHVQAIATLDLSRITKLSYELRPGFRATLGEIVEKLLTGKDAIDMAVKEEVEDCLSDHLVAVVNHQEKVSDSKDAVHEQLVIESAKQYRSKLQSELEIGGTESLIENSADQVELLYRNMLDSIRAHRCFKYFLLVSQQEPLKLSLINHIAALEFHSPMNMDYSLATDYKESIQRTLNDLREKKTLSSFEIMNDLKRCRNDVV